MARTLTFEELKKMTVGELRDLASGMPHESLKGHSQMIKEHLLKAICRSLGIDMHVHHQVVGVDKSTIKSELKQLKKQRDEAIENGDHALLHTIRRRMHHLKREINKATI